MKILWLSHFPPWPETGHGALQRTHHLLRRVAARHEVHLLTLVPPAAAPTPEALRRTVSELERLVASVHAVPLGGDRFRLKRARCVMRSLLGERSYWENLFDQPAAWRHLDRLLDQHQFDLVHADIVFLSPYLDRLRHIPLALNHHNVESHLLDRRADSQTNAWARRFFRHQAKQVANSERVLAPRAATNLLCSELDEARLIELAGDVRTATIPNGVDVDFFRPHATPGARGHMVFAGGMDWFPNRDAMVHFATETWPALVREGAHRRLTVVGRNPPPELLKLTADARVLVPGFVDDVRPYVQEASIYICPIRVGGGTRLKVLDALAMARPLVGSDIGVEGLGLVDGEHFLRANTTDEYIAQIRRLEADPVLGARLGRAGRDFVERRYSWTGIAERLEAAYVAALAHDSAPRAARSRPISAIASV